MNRIKPSNALDSWLKTDSIYSGSMEDFTFVIFKKNKHICFFWLENGNKIKYIRAVWIPRILDNHVRAFCSPRELDAVSYSNFERRRKLSRPLFGPAGRCWSERTNRLRRQLSNLVHGATLTEVTQRKNLILIRCLCILIILSFFFLGRIIYIMQILFYMSEDFLFCI